MDCTGYQAKKQQEETTLQIHFFKFKQNLLHRILYNFPFLLLCIIKRFFKKKIGVTSLVFKIDAIDGKKWVKFVAMQQNRAPLIYDLNAVKDTVESYLTNIA